MVRSDVRANALTACVSVGAGQRVRDDSRGGTLIYSLTTHMMHPGAWVKRERSRDADAGWVICVMMGWPMPAMGTRLAHMRCGVAMRAENPTHGAPRDGIGVKVI